MNIVPSILLDTIESQLITFIHKPVGYPAEFMNRFSKEENLFVLHMSKVNLNFNIGIIFFYGMKF